MKAFDSGWRLALALLLVFLFPTRLTGAEGTAAAPVVFPSHWRTSKVDESVFQGRVFVVEAGKQGNPVILLVHGLGQAGLTDWLSVIPSLEENYHVIALDLPGFGRSDSPSGKYSPTNYASLLHEIKQRFTSDRIQVVGHSMGGAVALRYSQLYPHDINNVVLVDAAGILARTAFVKHGAGAVIADQQLPVLLEGVKSVASSYVVSLLGKLGRLPDPSSPLGDYPYLWGKLLTNRTNTNAALALVNEDFTQAVLDNSLPFAIIWGSDDDVAPLRTGKLLNGQLKNSFLEVIQGAGHVPMKTHTRTFNQILARALAGVSTENPDEVEPIREKSIQCNDESNRVISGVYDEVLIRGCRSVVLKDLVTRRLNIRDSDVQMENVVIESDTIAAVIERSVVVATNVRIVSPIGISVSDSSLDFAGTHINSSLIGIDIVYPSQFIFSISRLSSPRYAGNLHGQFAVALGALDTVVNGVSLSAVAPGVAEPGNARQPQ